MVMIASARLTTRRCISRMIRDPVPYRWWIMSYTVTTSGPFAAIPAGS